MGTLALIVITFTGYIVAYRTYGRFLADKIFALDKSAKVPARELEDGVDYVPTRKGVIFGHHYTSIAGTGPIVGPAIGVIWGWVPALIWVFVGSIVMGAVHDFGSLVLSLRNEGKSISDMAGKLINRRVRTIAFLVVFFELWIVIAVFAMIIALLFAMYPESVFAIWMEIPIAVWLGYMVYKRNGSVKVFTVLAVVAMYATVVAGHYLPLKLPPVFGLPSTGVWTIILLVYAYFASTLPVTTLLQPRDYINSWELFVAMGLLLVGGIASSFTGNLHIVAPPFNLSPDGAPPIWPFLFITIACGAISGFHSLVASGTTPKQISNERDALFVGYGSMLMEAALATLVLVAVAAGIGMGYKIGDGPMIQGEIAWKAHYATWSGAAGLGAKVNAVVTGSANLMATIGVPIKLGLIIMGVFIASFAATTLDSATRVQRYIISELFNEFKLPRLGSRWVATLIAVLTAAILAFSSGEAATGAMTLWPMFGAVNQLLAALALMLVTLYLKQKGGKKWLISGIPFAFMLILTTYAMVYNEIDFIKKGKWLLSCINGITLVLASWLIVEGIIVFLTSGHKAGLPEGVRGAGQTSEP